MGGNVSVSTVTQILGPALQGGAATADIGTLLPQLLPLLAKTQAGTGLGVRAPGAASPPTLSPPGLPLHTPLRGGVAAATPRLPPVHGAELARTVAVAGAAGDPPRVDP